jgi:tetratricopeptide (TPR) repeat protein
VYREAVARFEQAIVALERMTETPEVLARIFDMRMDMRRCLVPLGDYGRILANLTEAERIADRLSDRRRLGLLRVYMTDYYRLAGESVQAVATGEAALAFANEAGDRALLVLSRLVGGHAYHAVGEYRRAADLLQENIAAIGPELVRERFGSAGLPAVLSRGYVALSLADLGEFASAVEVAQEGVRLADEFDSVHSHAVVSHALGLAYISQGDFELGVPVLEETLARCRANDVPMGSRLLASALGYAYALRGRPDEGVPLLVDAIRQADALKVVFRYALWLAWLGESHALAGRDDAALALATQARDRAERHGEHGHRAYALRLIGDVLARSVATASEAEVSYHEALRLAQQLGMRPLEAHCHLGLSALHRRRGDAKEAAARLQDAAGLFEAMNMRFWMGRTQPLVAEV